MKDKVMTLLGFAAKAGKLSYGQAAAIESAQRKKARLMAVSGEISPKSLKEIKFYADKASIKTVVLKDTSITALSAAVGRSCGALSVNDGSFAEAIIKQLSTGGNANDE